MALRGTIIVPCDEIYLPSTKLEDKQRNHIDFLKRYIYNNDLSVDLSNSRIHGELEYQMACQGFAIVEYFDYDDSEEFGAIAYLPPQLGEKQREVLKRYLNTKTNWTTFQISVVDKDSKDAVWSSELGRENQTLEQFIAYIDNMPLAKSSSASLN